MCKPNFETMMNEIDRVNNIINERKKKAINTNFDKPEDLTRQGDQCYN